MAIHDWPARERPREKMLERGPGALSDAELLAVILGSGTKGLSAVDVGRNILKRFGSIRSFLTADPKDCLGQSGLGPVKLLTLQAALELARRHYLEVLRVGSSFESPDIAATFLLAHLRDRPYEVFCCIHLDKQRRFISFEELFRGTVDGATVHAREVVRQVIRYNSSAVIFAHNHPSGVAEPSHADEILTRSLKSALALVDVQVLDHFVVAGSGTTSFAERGLL